MPLVGRNLDADTLAGLIKPVALDLLGEPNKALSSRHELRFGANGSLTVGIGGEGRGQWYSFENGQGGGVLDLIIRAMGGDRAQAMAWLKSQPYGAGLRRDPPPRRRRKARNEQKKDAGSLKLVIGPA